MDKGLVLTLVLMSALFWSAAWGVAAMAVGQRKTLSALAAFCWGFFLWPVGVRIVTKRPDLPQSPLGRTCPVRTESAVVDDAPWESLTSQAS